MLQPRTQGGNRDLRVLCIQEILGEYVSWLVLNLCCESTYRCRLPRDGGRYRGRYECDDDTGKVSGCPALSAGVQDFYDTLKNLGKKGEGQERDHAEAMTIEVQRKMMFWSLQQWPSVPAELMVSKFAGASQEDLMEALKHFMVRAYMASAFTLWTR